MKGLEKSALSVSAVALFLSDLIKNQLGPVLIKGELSNLQLRKHSSYIRFSLKDTSAKIDCLTHNSTNAAKLLSHLQDGDEVLMFAQPSYYNKYGQISFFTEEMMKLGEGIFHSQLEQLRQQLYEEGLFDQSRKKSLPLYPTHIGVITSADGAALQDIIRVAQDRYPFVQIDVFPSLVQGPHSPLALLNALTKALSCPLDAIIIGRGGGSSEDLDAFNSEPLLRLVAESTIPIISAVGHETDTTLIDYVADFSAPTPTGAAMILLPDQKELLQDIYQQKIKIISELEFLYQGELAELDNIKEHLSINMKHYIQLEQQKLSALKNRLQDTNPKMVLEKGYAILDREQYIEGQDITIKTKDSLIYAHIQKITRNPHE